jgi:hypothetical protein
MVHYRLIDADFLINLIRTLSVIQEYDQSVDKNIEKICNNECRYKMISTKYVRSEVNYRISLKDPKDHELIFKSRKNEALKIKKRIFNVVFFDEMRNDKKMQIYEKTQPRNLGEKSLVALFSSKYSKQLNSGNSVKIVSNNTKDVIKELKIIDNKINLDINSIIMPNYEFFSDLFESFKFERSFRLYYYFVSNIDARVSDKKKIEKMLYKETVVYPKY